jgi:hypothetical protein
MTRYRSVKVTPSDEVSELLQLLRKQDEERRAAEEAEAAARAQFYDPDAEEVEAF